MTKLNRNAPCPCGSGKKYKKCCLRKDEETGADAALGRQAALSSLNDEMEDLNFLSNSVLDLIKSNEWERAEKACGLLLERYPDQIDGLERFAMVYEAKGDRTRAATYYRKTAEFMRSNPGFDKEAIAWADAAARRLEA
jgi:tetratricopeptide (TPR) repeat protein